MKRFMKGCGVTALILVVTGFILGFMGGKMAGEEEIERAVDAATGGRVSADVGNWWQWKLRSRDGLVDLGIGQGSVTDGLYLEEGAAEGTSWSEWDDGYGDDYEVVQDKDAMFDQKHDIIKGYRGKYCPGEAIKKLDIEVGGCNLYTEVSEDGRIYLEVGNAYRFQGYVEKETLYIRSKIKASITNWEESGHWITLYLPEGYRFEEVEAELGAGDLYFNELYAEEVSLEVGAGQIEIWQAQVDKLEATVGAGYVGLSDLQVRELDAEVGMGGLSVQGDVQEKADIECAMGNVDLILAGWEDDFNYHLEGAMGNIDLGYNSYSGLGTEKDINNHASKEMDIECSMGNITISFTEG